jgi:hypothetical protein
MSISRQTSRTRGNAFSKHTCLPYPPRSHVTRHDEATVGGTNDRGNCGFVSLGLLLSLWRRSHGHATDTTHGQGRRLHIHRSVRCHQELLASRGPQSSPGLPTSLADLHRQLHLYISAAFAFHLTLFSLFSPQALTSSPLLLLSFN